MDLQNNTQVDRDKVIVHKFFLKCLHCILSSRVPFLRPNDTSGDLYGRNDKWFNLALGATHPVMHTLWHGNLMDPMRIHIILVHHLDGSSVETVIERWIVRYVEPHAVHVAPQIGAITDFQRKTYQKLIVFFRVLYHTLRLLPTYKIFRQISKSSSRYEIDYKVSSFSDPLSGAEERMMKQYNFTPIEAHLGHLFISVTYRITLSDLNLQCLTSFPTKIITDYVGNSSMQSRIRYGTASVTLPHQVMGQRSAKNLSLEFSEPSTNSLPLSSGVKSIRKLTTSRTSQKKDDFDDGDFSCPFDVDDVDIPDFQSSQNVGEKSATYLHSSLPMEKKSQNASVGVLVHMLRTAPPLRQDPSYYSSPSSKTELEGGVATASRSTPKTVDALEELRSYREFRDLILSKRGSQTVNRDKALKE